ncbi:MAG: M56 family metallopeptidase [Clostridia bacterium]|nr:M56 family metallopeptidase [Clostridia bacterium]
MLGEIFYWLFNMSLAATICGIIILPLRRIRPIPRRIAAVLWAIPFLRMCIPIGLTSKYGLMTLLARITTKTVTVYELGDSHALTLMNHLMAANQYFPISYRVNLLEDLFAVAGTVWIVVAAALLLAFCILYFSTMREIKRGAVRLSGNLYRSDRIQTPAVYGILRPRIVIPAGYKAEELTYVLLHERTHIRRGDNLWRALAFFTVCLHWYNPFCWLFLKTLYADMEMACDEAVLSQCGEKQKKNYAHTLLSSVEKTNVFAAPFGGAKIRLRIEAVLSYKKISVFSLVGFAVLALAIAYVLLTNAA